MLKLSEFLDEVTQELYAEQEKPLTAIEQSQLETNLSSDPNNQTALGKLALKFHAASLNETDTEANRKQYFVMAKVYYLRLLAQEQEQNNVKHNKF